MYELPLNSFQDSLSEKHSAQLLNTSNCNHPNQMPVSSAYVLALQQLGSIFFLISFKCSTSLEHMVEYKATQEQHRNGGSHYR